MNVTGGAGAGTAAFRLDARNAVLDRGLHDGRTDLALDRAGGAFVIDVSDARHVIGEIVGRSAAAPGSYSGWRGRAPDDGRASLPRVRSPTFPGRCMVRQSMRVTVAFRSRAHERSAGLVMV